MNRPYQPAFRRELSDFCRLRLSRVLSPQDVDRARVYLTALFDGDAELPRRKGKPDWRAIAAAADIEVQHLDTAKADMIRGFRIVEQELARLRKIPVARIQAPTPRIVGSVSCFAKPTSIRRREPATFAAAFAYQLERHQDTCASLHRAIILSGERFNPTTFSKWRRAETLPQTLQSMEILGRIECRYRLPDNYFKSKLPIGARAAYGHDLSECDPWERARIAWHVPDDFVHRSVAEQDEILEWIRENVIRGGTEFRRFQNSATKHRFVMRFEVPAEFPRPSNRRQDRVIAEAAGTVYAPPLLQSEMDDLIRFKSAPFTEIGFDRLGSWSGETIAARAQHFGQLFGALVADPDGPARGLGVPKSKLTFALLVFPSVWDWYIRWREKRRGHFTQWERLMLQTGMSICRQHTGWLRQHPELACRLQPVEGLVGKTDIRSARNDWNAACDHLRSVLSTRGRQIRRIAKRHRDPFEPILPILEAESPLGEYRRISEEILLRLPGLESHPLRRAAAVRGFLMIRFALHLGLRQRNLRELLLCEPRSERKSERELAELRRGELRWNRPACGWEVFIPAAAFKNPDSSFFKGQPLCIRLPDHGRLYEFIEIYLKCDRPLLLGQAPDPRTFFVKTMRGRVTNAAFSMAGFYETWRLLIERYGIFNPYTGRGAIKGLLPHGPHNARDVLATHILKKTGSFEQAGYAIQDTPEVVAQHYGRFLPVDKAAIAANILNEVWREES